MSESNARKVIDSPERSFYFLIVCGESIVPEVQIDSGPELMRAAHLHAGQTFLVLFAAMAKRTIFSFSR